MIGRARIGLVGCGIIGRHYAERAAGFDSFQLVACADLDRASAEALADEQRLEALSVDELVAAPEVDVVLNLTPPSAHAAVIRAALAAGKHVYTEKPLASSFAEAAALVAEAERLGLRLGSAPDTFLGGAYQAARAAIAEGTIGEPISATATMLVSGPESWHPNADFFFRAGGGPLLDIAPYYLTAIASLLGPFAAATGFTAMPTPERTLLVGPRAGERFHSDVPTHAAAALRLESGALATLVTSFEARDQYVSELVLHGTEGMLVLPDANAFGGAVRVRRGRGDWRDVAYDAPKARESRGLGLDEMIVAMRAGRPHRASGSLALHVLETAEAVLTAAATGRTVDLATRAGERLAA